jgi:hypothetical protein
MRTVSVHTAAKYQRLFPNRRTPNPRVVYSTLRDTGTLPRVRITAEREVHQDADEDESIV